MTDALVEGYQSFAAGGKWAGEQLLRYLQTHKTLSPQALRTLDTLRKDEWISFDTALVEESVIRLNGVAGVVGAGLTVPIANSMGKTVYQYEKSTDMSDAEVSLDGSVRTPNSRVTFELESVPLPLTHKDFDINLRTLLASRTLGEPLDTTQARIAGRKVSESIELSLFEGGPTFGGNPIYGLLTEPDRNTLDFGTNGPWDAAAKTGPDILEDVLSMMQAAENDKYFGPYFLFVPRTYSTKLEQDFSTAKGDNTIRQRLMAVNGIRSLMICDQLADANVVLAQASTDVVAMLEGEPLQTIQWDIEGGMIMKFKAFQIEVPLVRSDAKGDSGVVHMSVP